MTADFRLPPRLGPPLLLLLLLLLLLPLQLEHRLFLLLLPGRSPSSPRLTLRRFLPGPVLASTLAGQRHQQVPAVGVQVHVKVV